MKPLAVIVTLVADTLLCGASRNAGDTGNHARAFALWAVALALSGVAGIFVAGERGPR